MTPSSPTPRRIFPGLAAAVVLLLLFVLLRPWEFIGPSAPRPGGSSATAGRARATDTAPKATPMTRRPVDSLRGPVGALASASGLPAGGDALTSATDQTTETPEQRWKRLGLQVVPVLVVDFRTSTPLQDVTVTVDGIHMGQKEGDSSSHGSWRTNLHGPAPVGITGADGRTTLASPIIMDDLTLATGLSFNLYKPGYATRRYFQYPVDGSERAIPLKQGNTLVVRAHWHHHQQPESQFGVQLSYTANVRPDQWVAGPDGSLTLDTLPDGDHVIALRAPLPDGRIAHSDPQVIKLAGGNRVEVDLALKMGLTLRGQLSENVPRPVRRGHVMVSSQFPAPKPAGMGSGRGGPSLMRTAKATIAPDGSFEIPNVPEGPGEIIGVCDGFIAAYSLPLLRPSSQGANQTYTLMPNSVPITLRMQPTGQIEVQVVDAQGTPLPGAEVWAWPNVFWSTGASMAYVNRERWSVTADGRGIAVLPDLPPGNESFSVRAQGWVAPVVVDPAGELERTHKATVFPGKTTRVRIQMEPAPP